MRAVRLHEMADEVAVLPQDPFGLATPRLVQRPQKSAQDIEQAARQNRCARARQEAAAIRKRARLLTIDHRRTSTRFQEPANQTHLAFRRADRI
jgi:hypothetical protein